jgi:hypothetical protein
MIQKGKIVKSGVGNIDRDGLRGIYKGEREEGEEREARAKRPN